ncbi:MAG: ABC transporter ATP-binding protein [Planctomycetales bacterium]|nr:ABC transporter ATP-binding protein [Planctomycetales bacterium]
MSAAILVENVSKRYRISENEGEGEASYRRLSEELMQIIAAPLRRVKKGLRPAGSEDFWALRDINFEVQRGEAVGVVGRNGAGKSTLLKIISRITRPTTGRLRFRGRIGSLLEVGTGFHPELSGRENVFLNGSILGMSRREIQSKFDEIVAFSNVEQFIDTPVKRYSSGMRVRLGFSVAAHLDPEILIVDEVLAVGDTGFRRKCLQKMRDEAMQGRTVLFVSHNMMAIQSLCDRCLMLERGQVMFLGDTDDAIEKYRAQFAVIVDEAGEEHAVPLADRQDRRGNGSMRFTDVRIFPSDARDEQATLLPLQSATVEMRFRTQDAQPLRNVNMSFTCTDEHGTRIFSCVSKHQGTSIEELGPEAIVRCHIPALPLAPGNYQLDLKCAAHNEQADSVERAVEFTVADHDVFGTGHISKATKHGPIVLPHSWNVEDPQGTSDIKHAWKKAG